MTVSTVTVSIAVNQVVGTALPYARVRFELTAADVDGGVISPEPASVTLDVDGAGSIALWPNASGSQGTRYRVYINNQYGGLEFSGYATIPAFNCNLHSVLNLDAPDVVSDITAHINNPEAAHPASAIVIDAIAGRDAVNVQEAIEELSAAIQSSGGSFVDLETPTGTIDGANPDFVLEHAPTPARSCVGYVRQGGAGTFLPLLYGIDFTLAAAVATLTTAPDAGSELLFSYRY